MTVLKTTFQMFSLLILIVATLPTYAQVSAYDSMYFPTTQSIEGSRNAAMYYDLVNIEFDKKPGLNPSFLNDIKGAYTQNLDTLPMFAHDKTFTNDLGQNNTLSIFNSGNDNIDFLALHQTAANRILAHKAHVENAQNIILAANFEF